MSRWILERLYDEAEETNGASDWAGTIAWALSGDRFAIEQVGRLLDQQGPDHWSRKPQSV